MLRSPKFFVRSSGPYSSTNQFCLDRKFKQIKLDTPLATLSRIFETHHFALVVTTQKCASTHSNIAEKTVVYGVVTRIDLLDYIMAGVDGKGSSRQSHDMTEGANGL